MFCKIAVSAITAVVTYEPVPHIARVARHFYEHPASMSVAALWLAAESASGAKIHWRSELFISG